MMTLQFQAGVIGLVQRKKASSDQNRPVEKKLIPVLEEEFISYSKLIQNASTGLELTYLVLLYAVYVLSDRPMV